MLITGIGGGVGVAAAQVARLHHLTVIGTASAAKKDFVESLGATPVEYGEGVADRIRAAAPRGIDAILDLVGGDALEQVAPLLADRTKLVSGADRATVARLGGAPIERPRTRAILEQVATWVAEGPPRPARDRGVPAVRGAPGAAPRGGRPRAGKGGHHRAGLSG